MSVLCIRWGEERSFDGTTRKYWVSSFLVRLFELILPLMFLFVCIIDLKSRFPLFFSDCCKLLGKELGRERLLPHRPRRQRVRDRSVCDWRVGPNHDGGHAQPPPPPPPPPSADLDAWDGTMAGHLLGLRKCLIFLFFFPHPMENFATSLRL